MTIVHASLGGTVTVTITTEVKVLWVDFLKDPTEVVLEVHGEELRVPVGEHFHLKSNGMFPLTEDET